MITFTSKTSKDGKDVLIYMGKDKHENEELIRFAFAEDVWFHVDKLSSAHVYLRLPEDLTIDTIPAEILADAAQLTKANSITGNKTDNVTIIYTPASNLKKDGSMDTGQVSFHSDKRVRRTHVHERVNAIVNRLNKTKKVVEVDHEAELVERQRQEARAKRAEATVRTGCYVCGKRLQRNAELELVRRRKLEAEGRNYKTLHQAEADEDEEWERKQRIGEFDPDEDFM